MSERMSDDEFNDMDSWSVHNDSWNAVVRRWMRAERAKVEELEGEIVNYKIGWSIKDNRNFHYETAIRQILRIAKTEPVNAWAIKICNEALNQQEDDS